LVYSVRNIAHPIPIGAAIEIEIKIIYSVPMIAGNIDGSLPYSPKRSCMVTCGIPRMRMNTTTETSAVRLMSSASCDIYLYIFMRSVPLVMKNSDSAAV
jgi:hypothetical protein